VTYGCERETSFDVEQFICNLHQFDKLTCRCNTAVSRWVLPKDWQIQIVNKNLARGFAIRHTKAMYCYTLMGLIYLYKIIGVDVHTCLIRDWLEPPLTVPSKPQPKANGAWCFHERLLFLIRIELKWNVLTNHHL
jgi:hypothetical protein